ncbi:sigma-54-dependent Fis family transcriptional regulator [Paramagnetospirillum marisnigri]|uniref:Sigma-54-dependent Fis family transcriptional regulator n=1 Tax=Paramagnetospirillum marisnigri TaxID=1285242 RepID=A0A178MDY2_9PROT|nr:sigma-54 dependent transcriptional regulator [Paramagnetospirillum marisnigri]OAN46726.1 sigma-54-dependent Fis family transcriptional regulator [Paramagnetospirillum marisnigri]
MADISVLIIDDEVQLVRSVVFALKGEGIAAWGVHSGAEGLDEIERRPPDLVLLDQRLPDMLGIAVLEQLRKRQSTLPVVMISAHGDTRAAVQAVKAGASDYLTKPFELDDLIHVIRTTLERERLAAEVAYHRKSVVGGDGVIGDSPIMADLIATVARIAASSASRVLLLGESGTGKGLVARSIHNQSSRARGAFVEVNCASLPEQLIEAELFGAEKGAYTGAHQRRVGLVALADGGTLFLDEIGELPLALQAKFLHFLENGNYRAIGATQGKTADVRIVAATNRDLAADVKAGRFREDLYYRLNVIQLRLPALRERGGDALDLARYFARRYAAESGCPPVSFAPEVERLFASYSWPGNVRELKNLIERLTILHPGQTATPAELPADMAREPRMAGGDDRRQSLPDSLDASERVLLTEALARAGGQKGRAAELLGISRHAFKRRLQRLGLMSGNRSSS